MAYCFGRHAFNLTAATCEGKNRTWESDTLIPYQGPPLALALLRELDSQLLQQQESPTGLGVQHVERRGLLNRHAAQL
jgi:hypothetical protein